MKPDPDNGCTGFAHRKRANEPVRKPVLIIAALVLLIAAGGVVVVANETRQESRGETSAGR